MSEEKVCPRMGGEEIKYFLEVRMEGIVFRLRIRVVEGSFQ